MKITSSALLFSVLAFSVSGHSAEPSAPPTDVVLVPHEQVDAAFAKGLPIVVNSSYKVQAGRRVAPGVVEIHEHDTDIFYITEGSATFVTGGTPVESKPSGPGEIRAKEISGGTPRHLNKGDVIIIPSGVPHQFTEVSGTFLYYVVKVTK